jgi:hypothetical protein
VSHQANYLTSAANKKNNKARTSMEVLRGGKDNKKVREVFQPDKLPFRASGKFQFSFLSFDDGIRRVLVLRGGKD